MTSMTSTQRFGAMASLMTSLMLVSGCRSAAVNSPNGVNSSPAPWGVPFYRSYERSPRSYDDIESPNLQPIPPSEIPPVPGYSEPNPSIPPAPTPSPSAQKSRWKPKLPTFGQNGQVNQTAAKAYGTGGAGKAGRTRSSQSSRKAMHEEIVHARSGATNTQPELSPAEPFDAEDAHEVVISPGYGDDEVLEQPVLEPPKLQTPIKTRYGVIREWPAGTTGNRGASNRSSSSESVREAAAGDDTATDAPSNVPHLLPPSA